MASVRWPNLMLEIGYNFPASMKPPLRWLSTWHVTIVWGHQAGSRLLVTTDSGYRDINTARSKHGRAGPSNVSLDFLNFNINTVTNMECNIFWLKAPGRVQGTVFWFYSLKYLIGVHVSRHLLLNNVWYQNCGAAWPINQLRINWNAIHTWLFICQYELWAMVPVT